MKWLPENDCNFSVKILVLGKLQEDDDNLVLPNTISTTQCLVRNLFAGELVKTSRIYYWFSVCSEKADQLILHSENESFVILALYCLCNVTSSKQRHLRLLAPWATRLLSQ